MCGIVARVGRDDAIDFLLSGLENLEYRGYDSAGVAVKNGTGLYVNKQSGQVSALKDAVSAESWNGTVGIGHTRWSTHGPPTDENAHPHTSQNGRVAVVHNGVLENYDGLRAQLREEGYEFTSDTDTEVVPHLVEKHLADADSNEEAFRRTVADLEGSYAIAALIDGTDSVFAARQGSPLVCGLDETDGAYYLASDVPAFLEHTDRALYFQDGDVAVLRQSGVEITTVDGTPVSRDVETIDWNAEETGKGGYDHYMLKEIDSQPAALRNTIRGRIADSGDDVALEEFPPGTFADVESVQFVACGTSYHAAVYGSQLLQMAGVPSSAYLASEYTVSDPIDENTLVVAVTQSGETADTLRAVRRARDAGARTLAVTNVVGSTATRECEQAFFIRAGPEIGVAATKTFSSQVTSLAMLTDRIGRDVNDTSVWNDPSAFYDALERFPATVEEMLSSTDPTDVAERYRDSDAYFFIGRDVAYPVALEGALKFKEITYEHAEGFASGELKHGPLALVTPDTPVFAVFTGRQDEKTLTNAKEAQTRGAPVVAVAREGHSAAASADAHLPIPETHPVLAGLLANVQLQRISYHAAALLGRPIDKPRNLAKSVTVE
jgi:glucosamine--fructose-6-phosphate aminotransferase (isomerizing)